jgi:outer membrane protein assembly factor BamB
MSGRRARLVIAGTLAAATLLAAGAAFRERARARHLALPVLVDPSLPPIPAADLGPPAPCAAEELARVGGRVTALLAASDGELWVGTFDGGLHRPLGGRGEMGALRGRERFVNALAEHDGLVWVATQGGLLAVDGERRVLTLLAGEGVTALVRARGALYAGTARGVHRVGAAGGAVPLAATGPSGEPLRVTALAAAGGQLFVGTASGVYALALASLDVPLLARTARWIPLVFGEPAAETNVVTALAPLAEGVVAGTDDGGVVRVRQDGRVVAVRFSDVRANEVNPGAAAAIRDGAAVLGTQGGGALLVRPRGDGLEVVRAAALERAAISAVAAEASPAGGSLVGTADGAVVRLACEPGPAS